MAQDKGPPPPVDRALIALGSASGVTTLLMILIVVPDVFARKFFSVTIPAASEINIQLLVLLIFLGLAGAEARNAHFTVTSVTDRLGPRWRRAMAAITTALSLAFASIMAWASGVKAVSATLQDERTIGVYSLPVWPIRIIVALGFALLALQLLMTLRRICTSSMRST